MIMDVLSFTSHGAELLRVADLVTGDLSRFRVALAELVRWCEATQPGYPDTGYRIVLNLNGGFKLVQVFLQALGMLYAYEGIYAFTDRCPGVVSGTGGCQSSLPGFQETRQPAVRRNP
jgi:hypothetical protein